MLDSPKDESAVDRYVLIFFMDGVGLGSADPLTNPFVSARMPNMTRLIGRDDWYLAGNGPIVSERATFVPTDANLSTDGRPQSATGQAAILTGKNVPSLVGEHYGPKPNQAVAAVIREGTLFSEFAAAGQQAALLSPYPQGYFDAIASGKRIYSAVPLAATSAGWPLMTYNELRDRRAVSPDFTNEGWRDFLGYKDLELISLFEAGRRLAEIASTYDFSFFEHWPSDRSGHRGTLDTAKDHLERIDEVIGGLLAAWQDDKGLLLITSDHGNIEDKSHRLHTRNPVPTIIVGQGHEAAARQISDLTHIAAVVRAHAGVNRKKEEAS